MKLIKLERTGTPVYVNPAKVSAVIPLNPNLSKVVMDDGSDYSINQPAKDVIERLQS
ncbi:hypothetical protein [Vibrio sp. HN007]|uniref:hypothetical protein n=1 Tax=Vibrio iocasae TaxID=3098914 RepID=UPI0035D52614